MRPSVIINSHSLNFLNLMICWEQETSNLMSENDEELDGIKNIYPSVLVFVSLSITGMPVMPSLLSPPLAFLPCPSSFLYGNCHFIKLKKESPTQKVWLYCLKVNACERFHNHLFFLSSTHFLCVLKSLFFSLR